MIIVATILCYILYIIYIWVKQRIRILPIRCKTKTSHSHSITTHLQKEGFEGNIFQQITMQKCNTTSKELLILFIPGNPGIPQLYLPFFKKLIFQIEQQTRNEYTITLIAIGYLGHDLYHWNGSKLFSLSQQIAHKKHVIHSILKSKNSVDQILFLGHSMGSYLTINSLFQLFEEKSLIMQQWKNKMSIFAITPIVRHISKTTNANSTHFLLWHRKFIFALFSIGTFLFPFKTTSQLILKFILKNETHPIQTELQPLLYKLVNADLLNNILYMTEFEFKEIQECEAQIVTWKKQFAKQIIWIFAEQDGWVNEDTIDWIKENIAPSTNEVHILKELKHAFTLYQSDSQLVATLIARHLKSSMLYTTNEAPDDLCT